MLSQMEVIDGMGLGIMAINHECRVITINRVAEKFLGTKRENILGVSLYEAFPQAPEEVRFVEKTLATELEVVDVEYPYVWGEFNHYLKVSTYVLRDEQGQKTGALVAFTDVTESRRLAKRQLRSSQVNTINRVIIGLAHELRNPMVIIRGYLEMYLRRRFLCPKRRRTYILLTKQIDKANALIHKFEDIYQPSTSEMVPVNLEEVVRYVVGLMQPMAWSSQARLREKIAIPGLTVMGDRERLEQVLINLVKNALEALIPHKNGKVDVLLLKDGFQACIIVRDNGCGIPQRNISRLGIPFFTTKPDGKGIGLALSWSVIDQHEGSIEVESEDGEGTSVMIFLPL